MTNIAEPTPEMIEFAARVICEAKGYDPDAPITETMVQWEAFKELARSTAMRSSAPQEPVADDALIALAEKAKPLLECEHHANRPNPRISGERIVGFVIGANDIGLGLSEPLFALGAVIKLAQMSVDRLQAKAPETLWLWRNFVDGRPEYWAFDNPFPCESAQGDPLTLGQPCGWAILKPSVNGRPDVPTSEVHADMRRAGESWQAPETGEE